MNTLVTEDQEGQRAQVWWRISSVPVLGEETEAGGSRIGGQPGLDSRFQVHQG